MANNRSGIFITLFAARREIPRQPYNRGEEKFDRHKVILDEGTFELPARLEGII
jgi:hypothetical protein